MGLALLMALSGVFMARSSVAATLALETATIADLQAAMTQGTLTAERLVQLYLARIAAYDKKGPALNTVMTFPKSTPALAGEALGL